METVCNTDGWDAGRISSVVVPRDTGSVILHWTKSRIKKTLFSIMPDLLILWCRDEGRVVFIDMPLYLNNIVLIYHNLSALVND